MFFDSSRVERELVPKRRAGHGAPRGSPRADATATLSVCCDVRSPTSGGLWELCAANATGSNGVTSLPVSRRDEGDAVTNLYPIAAMYGGFLS